MNNKFWFVWNPNGHTPRYKHESLESAKAEAKRIAMQLPGQELIVLESIGTVVKNDVLWKSHDNIMEEIPF